MGINEKLTAIADNIREYTGKTDLLSLDGMAQGVVEAADTVCSGICDGTITNLIIRGSCQKVTSYAFNYQKNLKSVIIERNRLSGIYMLAFGYCTALEEVKTTEPIKIVRIGSKAFYGCSALKVVDFSNCTAIPSLDDANAFGGIPDDCVIYVPPTLYTEWLADTTWGKLSKHIQPYCEHNYEQTEAKTATCTEDGYIIYTCKKCGYSYKDIVEKALGHDLYEEGVDATCTSAGWYRAVCQRDGCDYAEYNESPALGHDMSDPIEDVEPTCTEDGSWHAYCRRCGYVGYGTRPALGHDMAGDHQEPTCTEGGYRYELCQRDGCDYEITEEYEPLGHDWEEKHDGASVYLECKRCGAIESIA